MKTITINIQERDQNVSINLENNPWFNVTKKEEELSNTLLDLFNKTVVELVEKEKANERKD